MNFKRVFFIFIFLLPIIASCKIIVIKNPKPTHYEKKYKPLELHAIINPEIDDEHFLALPFDLVVDKKGSIFLYDIKFRKIFKFNNKYKFIKQFGRGGLGPGDFNHYYNTKSMYISWDNYLYIADGSKLMKFDTKGRFIDEWQNPPDGFIYKSVPVKESFFFILKPKNFSVIKKQNRKTSQLLNIQDNSKFLLYEPELRPEVRTGGDRDKILKCFFDYSNICCDFTSKNSFFIYLKHSSELKIYKGFRLKKTISILPKNALESFKSYVNKIKDTLKKKNLPFYLEISLFDSCFIDKDNQKYVYLQRPIKKEDRQIISLYKFDFEGKLIDILFVNQLINKINIFVYKRNNLFYALGMGNIFIFKEGKDVKAK